MLESVATHTIWTRNYYKLAWPGLKHEFWRDRSQSLPFNLAVEPELRIRLHEAYAFCEQQEAIRQHQSVPDAQLKAAAMSPDALSTFLQSPVALSPYIHFMKIPCVVDDRVQLCTAVAHPKLARPVAFLAGFELVSLLHLVPMAHNLGQLISFWSMQMPFETATNIAIWLQEQGLLRTW